MNLGQNEIETIVGNRELVKALAEQLVGDYNLVIEMKGLFMEHHSIAQLSGAPPW